jgi:hypothetical protein
VLLGNGDGTFQSAVSYAVGDQPGALATEDFNGDGKADLAVANYTMADPPEHGLVMILLGNGNGTFQSPVNYHAGVWPCALAVGDLNGDQEWDLAVANQQSNNVSVMFGTGTGAFLPPEEFGADKWPSAVAAGDLDKDGTWDLVVANRTSDNVSVLSKNDLASCTDSDGDGFGAPSSSICTYGIRDCNDSNPNVHPAAEEIPGNRVDDDCDGRIDEPCFIATASFGEDTEGKIDTLRSFRDLYLLRSSAGRAFVDAYYRWSPFLADSIAEREGLRLLVRTLLLPLIGLAWLFV